MLNIKKYINVTLILFLITSIFSLILRYIPLSEGNIEWNYQYILQTHSHLAFLGWVYNCIFLLTVKQYPNLFQKTKILNFDLLFIIFKICILFISVGLMIWGYKVLAITFLSLHSLFTIIFAVKFNRYADENKPGTYLLKLAFIMMGVSYVGTLLLGPLSAMGLKGSNYYYSAIYFYMHFQYNGFFLFAVIGLLLNFWKQININVLITKKQINLLLLSVILTYSISILFAKIHFIISIIAVLSSLFQIYIVLNIYLQNKDKFKLRFQDLQSKLIIYLVLLLFISKLIAQVVSPLLPDSIASNRNIIIVFLHLNFLGIITPLLLYFIDVYFVKSVIFRNFILVYTSAIILNEISIILSQFNILSQYELYYSYLITTAFIFLLILNLNLINLFEKSKYNLSVSIWNKQLNKKQI